MGRGIEGTGNTKYAIELQSYLESIGEQCEVIANADKKWGREKSHENHIKLISFSKSLNELKEKVICSDQLIILSVPAKNFGEITINAFMDLIEEAYVHEIKMTYFQVDHKINSINRNFYSLPKYFYFLNLMTNIITHSLDGDFTRFCKKHEIELNNLITASDKLNGINGFNFEEYKKYWKSFEDKEYKSIKFLGRSAAWKGPYLFREMHEKSFRKNGYISTLEGIEKSIQSLKFLYSSWDPIKIVREDTTLWNSLDYAEKLNKNLLNFERNHNVYMLPPYKNSFAMERMSKQQFGIELLTLDDRFLGDIMEYAMMEIIAVGTVPIFRKRWGELFKINGIPLIKYGKECGIIFLDENYPELATLKMNKLSNNKEMYNEYRNNAYNFFNKHLNNKVIFGKLLSLI